MNKSKKTIWSPSYAESKETMGHEISTKVIELNKAKINVIHKLSKPKHVKDI